MKRSRELLKVSRSAYYQHRTRPSRRDRDDADLTARIADIHAVSAGTYGAPRVHAELVAQGRRHSRKRVASGVDSRWCGDIIYIPTWEGWQYLATVIEIASRRVVGWATAEHLRTDLPAQALTNAVATGRPTGQVIFQSDRGCPPDCRWPGHAETRRLPDARPAPPWPVLTRLSLACRTAAVSCPMCHYSWAPNEARAWRRSSSRPRSSWRTKRHLPRATVPRSS
ncbi:DDE-type integrase/transposase/recombinase [Micromonospora sp. NPDC047793]|uniref:DDE-type integrase/transposase/recombinase n=1 Tax=Micromonospora sp. NPDC047793 TaxID=3154342 RepID=UPI0033E83284